MRLIVEYLIQPIVMFTTLAESLVVTQHSADTLLTYHNLLRQHTNIEAEISFAERNLSEYCDKSRKAKIFNLLNTGDASIFGHPGQRLFPHNMTTESLEIEHRQIGLELVKFRLVTSNHQLLPRHTFQCMDFDGELKWFVTPAFIPDSAFVFTVQPNIALVFAKKIGDHLDEIPARFVAIIDESSNIVQQNDIAQILTQSLQITNRTGRDPLCDLNPILKYRICATVVPNMQGRVTLDLTTLADSEASYQDNWYYMRQSPHCRPVHMDRIHPHIPNSDGMVLQLLHCSISSYQFTSAISFSLALNMLNKFQVIYFGYLNSFITYSPTNSLHEIPLLRHLTKYKRHLGDIQI